MGCLGMTRCNLVSGCGVDDLSQARWTRGSRIEAPMVSTGFRRVPAIAHVVKSEIGRIPHGTFVPLRASPFVR